LEMKSSDEKDLLKADLLKLASVLVEANSLLEQMDEIGSVVEVLLELTSGEINQLSGHIDSLNSGKVTSNVFDMLESGLERATDFLNYIEGVLTANDYSDDPKIDNLNTSVGELKDLVSEAENLLNDNDSNVDCSKFEVLLKDVEAKDVDLAVGGGASYNLFVSLDNNDLSDFNVKLLNSDVNYNEKYNSFTLGDSVKEHVKYLEVTYKNCSKTLIAGKPFVNVVVDDSDQCMYGGTSPVDYVESVMNDIDNLLENIMKTQDNVKKKDELLDVLDRYDPINNRLIEFYKGLKDSFSCKSDLGNQLKNLDVKILDIEKLISDMENEQSLGGSKKYDLPIK